MVSTIIRRSNSSIPSSSSTPRWTYDVFLSFRGEDTREKFVDHLYTALDQRGIYTFKDDEQLERGKAISPELLTAIEESGISIVVLSENYASSRWCLDELVKILECKDEIEHTIYPVFYHVDPSEVRRQTGRFGKGFAKVASKNEMEKVQKWREALEAVANLSGWPYPSERHRFESKFIQELVGEIISKLNHTHAIAAEDLVGMDSRAEKVIALLGLRLDDIRVVGIWGMGGIGKTTIARAVLDRISSQFEGKSFLENIREVSTKSGLESLQEQLIYDIFMEKNLKGTNSCRGRSTMRNRACRKRVLIVLDDMNEPTQIEEIVGKYDRLGFGSRIIITTRDKHLLHACGVKDIYEVDKLGKDDAVMLFRWKAFAENQQTTDFKELIGRAIEYAGGVPLALKVLGSFLYGRSISEWESALKKLKERPDKRVLEVLKISYDGLDLTEKQIFLDIACFLKGEDKNSVTKILDSCGFHAEIGINILVEKSLITILGNRVGMHDLIQDLGHDIVFQESKEPGERSRLWRYKDVHHVLMKNTGRTAVESIVLQFPGQRWLQLRATAFAKMTRLRLLKICKVRLPKGLVNLSNELRYLDWHGYPLKHMPRMFQPEHLVELHMSNSSIEQLWEGTMTLASLRVMNLSQSTNLTKSPNFTGVPNLEELILEGCTSLVDLHPSIGFLKKLTFFNLKHCENLKSLPTIMELQSLETLILSACQKLMNIPKIFRNMKHLLKLYMDETGLTELSLSVGHLTSLDFLDLRDCQNLRSLPNSICQLKDLNTLILSKCSKLFNIPEIFGNMKCLSELYINGTGITELPVSIGHLTSLNFLNLGDCQNLRSLPSSICQLRGLNTLILSKCSKFMSIPENFGTMKCLVELCIDGTAITELPVSVGHLTNLNFLGLGDCRNLTSLPDSIRQLKALDTLILSKCSKLINIPDIFEKMKCLFELCLDGTAITDLPVSVGHLTNLNLLDLGDCQNLSSIPDSTCQLKALRSLILSRCSKLVNIPDIFENMKCLICLRLNGAGITELPVSIGHLTNLFSVDLEDCRNLTCLPNSICQLQVFNTLMAPKWYDTNWKVICPYLEIRIDGTCLTEFLPSVGLNTNLVTLTFSDLLHFGRIPRSIFMFKQWNILDLFLANRFQGNSSQIGEFGISFPGTEIPKWFNHRNDKGSPVSFQLPENWYNNRFLGVAFGVVIELDPNIQISTELVGQLARNRYLGSVLGSNTEIVHVYYSHNQLKKGETEFKVSFIAANCPGLTVKKCGVRLVYQHEAATAIPIKRRRRLDQEDPNSKRLRQFIDEPMDIDMNHEAPSSSKWVGQSIEPMDLDLNHKASPSGSGCFCEEDPIDLELRL